MYFLTDYFDLQISVLQIGIFHPDYDPQQNWNLMIRLILPALFFYLINADCPLTLYPQQTVSNSIIAQLDNNFNLHGRPQQYIYTLEEKIIEGPINVAIGISGFQFNAHLKVDFTVDFIPSSKVNQLKFNVQVNDNQLGWKSMRFNFFATQSQIFQTVTENTGYFSKGLEEGKYSIYRPIPNFNNFQMDPIVKVFIHGIQLFAKPLDQQYNQMLSQFEGFKKFSSNSPLTSYFIQALQQKKSMTFKIYGTKILGRVLSLNIETNCQLKKLKFTYLVFSQKKLQQKDSFIMGDFFLSNGDQFKASSLRNMGMLVTGLIGFKVPRDQLYSFSLTSQTYFGQSYFGVQTNYKYLTLDFSFIAFQKQQRYVCEECTNSPNIFDDKLCVSSCPRSFSRVQRLQNFYCQKCDVQKLKVVDPSSGQCVCAKRHYLQQKGDTCKPCRYDCMTCQSISKCLTCDNNLFQTKRKLNSLGRCECPQTGYYDNKITEDIVCQKCDSRCLTCNGPHSHDCLSCVANKQLDPLGFCVCKNGYLEDSSGNCNCNPPSIQFNGICIDNQTQCNQNQTQQFVQMSRRCICKSGFIQVSNNCVKCGKNSIFDKEQLKCRCSNQTVFMNGQCLPCGNNQQFDDSASICVCKPGTFKTEQGNCVTCPLKMAYINGKCQCIFNYFESRPGFCERCYKQTDGPKCRRNGY